MQTRHIRFPGAGIILAAIASVAVAGWGCRSSAPTGPHAAAKPPAHSPAGTNLSAEAAIARLKAGNARFRSGDLRHPDQTLRRLHEVESSQHPFAVIVSCSDSRVPPEIVFDEGLGDLFVVREAGHVGGAATLGSVEYAVEHLHVRLVVVMGHENCGAVSAATEVIVKNSRPEGHIITLVDAIRPAVEQARRGPEAGLVGGRSRPTWTWWLPNCASRIRSSPSTWPMVRSKLWELFTTCIPARWNGVEAADHSACI